MLKLRFDWYIMICDLMSSHLSPNREIITRNAVQAGKQRYSKKKKKAKKIVMGILDLF